MFRFGDPGGRMYATAGTSGANILANWTSCGVISVWSVSAGSGRVSGSALAMNATFGGDFRLIKTLDAQQTWGVAFGFKPAQVPASSSVIAGFADAGTTQVDVRLNTDMTLAVTRNGTTLATSTFALTPNAYCHLELKAKVDPTVGTYELRVNGVTRASGTGANTRATANSTANQVFIGAASNANGFWYYDDVIFYDGQANDANGNADISDFIGDCGLTWLLPTGAGTTTQFTPDAGSNYARVNEATPDGDTSYVASSTVGNVDTYAMADLGASISAVKSVAVVAFAGKTDTGSRGLKTVLRSAGANATHAAEVALGNSYTYNFQSWGKDPNAGTPAAWTVAAVNALEAGQAVSS